ncbi:fatty acid desaturase family protein [Legionella sainthelensi]|uniref:fatty acid desaturase family protein n=1 Tax=Legionella sainthelensi TaxID=28087 RepID=UPI000E2004D5|nr:fatty acid desaturase [Legionella sainthelensi]
MNNNRYPWGVPQAVLQRAYQKSSLYVITKLCFLFFIWYCLGFCILKTPSIGLKIILWFFLGYFINGLVQLVHDSWHHTLFPKRWQNRLLGHALSFLFFVLYHPPRHGHLLHHRYNRTERDPDAYNTGKRSWDLVLLYYGVFLLGVPLAIIHFNVLYPLQFYKRHQLRKHFLQLGFLILVQVFVWILLVQKNMTHLACQTWLIPVFFTSIWNGMKSVADHFQNDWQGSPLKTATTVTSNPLTTFFWNGLNYHLEHHLFPGVPGYNLPLLHPHLKELFQQNRSSLFSSYYKIWWRALIRGPEVIDREGKFNPFKFQNEN